VSPAVAPLGGALSGISVAEILVAAFAVVHALQGSAGVDLPLTGPSVVLSLAGAALHLGVVAALGVASGWVLRSTAGSLAAVVAVLHVLPVIGPGVAGLARPPPAAVAARQRRGGTDAAFPHAGHAAALTAHGAHR